MADVSLSSALEEIRQRSDWAIDRNATEGELYDSARDVPSLLAAVTAVLELHRPIRGDMTGCAAGGCTWKWPCPTVRAITRELTRKGDSDGA